ncbi:MAG TPA: protein kinase [Bryobacterales bacterium]|nr:protein kinase [Bryobacterales bacterium]
MALAAGTRLGPYEILGSIGAGGMGEVYKARDPRIGREVAIKILPAALAADADRLRRFEQEVQAVGALNHPNILTIYDVGTHDGAPYIVSELLEGETLRERLSGGPLPQRRAIEYAAAIARGLAAAHEKGIVHRDLKPENLFLTKDGRVKILDFGLAKLTHVDLAATATNAPTMAQPTEPGVVLGTVGYMSPEQVRGKPTDPRADLFSFGAILYEMLAGRRAFRGETAAETMTAILKEDPPDLIVAGAAVAPALDRLIRHCLEKAPEQRFQAAGDLAFALEALSGVSVPSGAAPAGKAAAQRRLWPAAVALAGLLAVALAYWLGRGTAKAPAAPVYHRLTFRNGRVETARFSPDGKTILYGGAWGGQPVEIFMTRPESPESTPLGLPDADILSVSSSGELALSLHRRFLEAFETRGTLARRPFAGGAPRQILENVIEADWSPSGGTQETGLAIVRRAGAECRLEFPAGKVLYQTSGLLTNIRFSPQGDHIAFLDHPQATDDKGSVDLLDLAGSRRVLSANWSTIGGLAWSSDGHEIWVTGSREQATRALYGVGLNGRERLILRDAGDLTLQDIARDGRILAAHENVHRGIVALPAGQDQGRDLSWFDRSASNEISSDGHMVLFTETGEGAARGYQTFLRSVDGSPPVQLGSGIGTSISPDGKWVLASQESGDLMILPTGPGEPKRFSAAGFRYGWSAWFPDGRRIAALGSEPSHGIRCYVLDRDGGQPRSITPEGVVWKPEVSPDGKWLAAPIAQRGPLLFPVEGGEPRPISGAGEDTIPIQWTPDGRALFIYTLGELPARIERLDLATGRRELVRQITPPDPAGIHLIGPVAITPDGKSCVYTYRRILSDLFLIEGLR